MRTPTWREIEEFCKKDGWEYVRSSNHTFYRKVLADGTVLDTHTSFADDKTMSTGRFASILRYQLRVSENEFWETLRSSRPATRLERHSPPLPQAIPTWILRVLTNELGYSESHIAELDETEARRTVEEYWSRRRQED